MSLYFEWDDANIFHIARHNVTPDEVESALGGFTLDVGYRMVDGEPRFTEIGVTRTGRYLEVTSTMRGDRVRVVTAYDALREGIQAYLRSR